MTPKYSQPNVEGLSMYENRQEQHNFHPCIKNNDNSCSSQGGWIPTTTMRKVLWWKQKTKWMNNGLCHSQWIHDGNQSWTEHHPQWINCTWNVILRYFHMRIVQGPTDHTLPLLVKLAWWIPGGGWEKKGLKRTCQLCAIGFSDKVTPGGPLSTGKARVPAAQTRPIVVPTRMGQTDEPIPVHNPPGILWYVWSWCGHLNCWLLT
jgi:hypothetical protein